jgi:hypothetical protein
MCRPYAPMTTPQRRSQLGTGLPQLVTAGTKEQLETNGSGENSRSRCTPAL